MILQSYYDNIVLHGQKNASISSITTGRYLSLLMEETAFAAQLLFLSAQPHSKHGVGDEYVAPVQLYEVAFQKSGFQARNVG